MSILCLLTMFAAQGQLLEWEAHTGNIPLDGCLLAEGDSTGMVIIIPLGDHGLGGWTGSGIPLPGFPVSASAGVSKRPAALDSPDLGNIIVYADNDGSVHCIDHGGSELPGWPVQICPNVVTGISLVDLNDDGITEIAFGTADTGVHLLDLSGNYIPGWPVHLPSRLQWQPSQLSMGGGAGYGLVCALVSTDIYLLTGSGEIAGGWPVSTGYSSGSIPVTADLDADGLGDIIFATYNRRLFALSSAGSILDGWPYFLNGRPVPGGMAVGRLDLSLEHLQVAASTIDDAVTLFNGDGGLAGVWKWPNTTTGVPTAPIIARTNYELAVIVGTDEGMVYAWSADGSVMNGYPFEFGQMVSTPPAAGDIDGDGYMELVVLGRSGKLCAYSIGIGGQTSRPWPQMLSDASNSGSYGSSALPRVTVEELTGEQSGNITLSYQTSGAPAAGISLAYSSDAGFTWQESYSFTDNGSEITWFSDTDLPGVDSYSTMLKITPAFTDGPGISGLTNVFHLDNNSPPTVYMSTPRFISSSTYELLYAVSDPEGDILHLQSQFSIDGGETWNTAHLLGSTYEIAPWFYGEPVSWYVRGDVGETDLENVMLRVRGADVDPGPWSAISDFGPDSEHPPSAQVVSPESEVSGEVTLGLRLSDDDRDPASMLYEYSSDAGETWIPATVIDWSIPYQGAEQHNIVWDSMSDLPGFESVRMAFRATHEDCDPGASIPSAVFHLDNNDEPTIAVIYPERGKTYSGSVGVTVQLADVEGDDLYIGLEYRLDDTDIWLTARGFDSDQPYTPHSYRPSLYWDSTMDLPGADREKVDLRFSVYDGDLIYSAVIENVKVDNRAITD